MDLTTLIGTSGASIILIAFIGNQVGKWKNESIIYDGLNVIGSVMLIIYAYLLGSFPFLVLNSVWAMVSLRDVCVSLYRGYKMYKKK